MKHTKYLALLEQAYACTTRKQARKILKKIRKDELLSDPEYKNLK